MGMFDTLYDKNGEGWQTKAFGRQLADFEIGDRLPDLDPLTETSYQVAVLGGRDDFIESLATVRDGVLVEVPDVRRPELPLMDYVGGYATEGN